MSIGRVRNIFGILVQVRMRRCRSRSRGSVWVAVLARQLEGRLVHLIAKLYRVLATVHSCILPRASGPWHVMRFRSLRSFQTITAFSVRISYADYNGRMKAANRFTSDHTNRSVGVRPTSIPKAIAIAPLKPPLQDKYVCCLIFGTRIRSSQVPGNLQAVDSLEERLTIFVPALNLVVLVKHFLKLISLYGK